MALQTQNARRRTRDKRPGSRPTEDYDRIKCLRCRRTYPALDGPALLYSLKASCPHCGGGFELVL